jgi:DNA-binding MarR family transcriptional regulator
MTAVQTSINAFHDHKASGKSADQRSRILGFIEAAGGDWSIGEIARALGLEKSTVSARINELVRETGELVERPKRKDRVSNITIRPVAIPECRGGRQ